MNNELRNQLNSELKTVTGKKEMIATAKKLAAIKLVTGQVTSSSTRMVAMVKHDISSGELKITGKKNVDKFLVSATILTLLHEDIEGGVMNKDSGESESAVLALDSKKVPKAALELFRKRYSVKSADLLVDTLNKITRHYRKVSGKTITTGAKRAGSMRARLKILSKLWTANWDMIATNVLSHNEVDEETKETIADITSKVGNVSPAFLKARNMAEFNALLDVLKENIDTTEEETDDAAEANDESEAVSAQSIKAQIDAMEADSTKEISEETKELLNHIKLIRPFLGNSKHLVASLTSEGVFIGIREFNMKPEDGIFIPSKGIIADAIIRISKVDPFIIDGVLYVLQQALNAKSAAQAKKTARETLGTLYRPNASKNIQELAIVVNDQQRIRVFADGWADEVLGNVYDLGWDFLSLSSPNKTCAVWSPRAGFQRKLNEDGTITLVQVVPHSARAATYEIAANPLVRYTDPKRCTTTFGVLTPGITDERQKVNFDVKIDSLCIEGQQDGIQPLTVFVPSKILDREYLSMKSTDKYASNVEDAYMMSSTYRKQLKLDETPLRGVIKLSQARNKGLVTSRFHTTVKVDGLDSNIDLISRGDGTRKNKLATQYLSAARLAAKMLGFSRILLVQGYEVKVLTALIRKCIATTGFNPLDATIKFNGVDGKVHTIKHVVVGIYQVMVDASQTYDEHVTEFAYTGEYMSAKMTIEATAPEIAEIAKAEQLKSLEHAKLLRTLSNLRKKTYEKGNVVYVTLATANSLFDKQIPLHLSGKFIKGKYTLLVNDKLVSKVTDDVTTIIDIIGYSNLAGGNFTEDQAKKLSVFNDLIRIPIAIKNGKIVVLVVRLPRVTPVVAYQNGESDEKHFVASKSFKNVLGILTSLRTNDDVKRKGNVSHSLNALTSTLKGAAYTSAKAPVRLPGIKGRVATKNIGDEDGFVIGKKAFVKMLTYAKTIRMLGITDSKDIDAIGLFADSIMDNLTMAKAQELKTMVETALKDAGKDGKIYVMAQRSPTLNYVASGFLEDIVDEELIVIPHKHGLKLAADDDGDPATLIFIDHKLSSFFNVLGVGTSMSRR